MISVEIMVFGRNQRQSDGVWGFVFGGNQRRNYKSLGVISVKLMMVGGKYRRSYGLWT